MKRIPCEKVYDPSHGTWRTILRQVSAAICLSFVCLGCAVLPGVQVHQEDASGSAWVSEGSLEATGLGIEDTSLLSETQRKSVARDAAIMRAKYEILALIKKMKLSDGRSIQQAIQADPKLGNQVQAAIQGAEIVRTEFHLNGRCRVTIRVPKSRLEEIVGNVSLPERREESDAP